MRRARAIVLGLAVSVGCLAVTWGLGAWLLISGLLGLETGAGVVWMVVGLLLMPLGLVAALSGPYLAARHGDWQSGLVVCVAMEITIALAVNAATPQFYSGPQTSWSFLLQAGTIAASVYGVVAVFVVRSAVARGPRALEGARASHARTIHVRAPFRTPNVSRESAGSLARLGCAMVALLAPYLFVLIPMTAFAWYASVARGLGAASFVMLLAAASVLVQMVVARRIAVAPVGGFEYAGTVDLAGLGERVGASVRRWGTSRIALLMVLLVIVTTGMLALAVRAWQHTTPMFALAVSGLTLLPAFVLGASVSRLVSIRKRPLEWMARQSGSTWVAKGEFVDQKKALGAVSIALGLPYPPGLQLIRSDAVNAWVVGDCTHAAIAVTEGFVLHLDAPSQQAAFASLVARIATGGVSSPALAAVRQLCLLEGSTLGASLLRLQAWDVHGALALRDVQAMEQALAATAGHGTKIDRLDGAFIDHLWAWPRGVDQVPESELHRLELLRAVDVTRATLRPEQTIRPRISYGAQGADDVPFSAWVVCLSCGQANSVALDRCVNCSASLG